MTDRRGLILIAAAAGLWGTTGTAQALGPDAAEPLAVGLSRLLIAGPALILIARPRLSAIRSDWRPLVVAGAGMAAYQPLFFTAVDLAGVAIGTVVAIGSAPLMAGALSWLVDREQPESRWWLATGLGVGGVVATFLAGRELGASRAGVAMALGAGMSFAVYLVASRRIVVKPNPVAGMALVFAAAAGLSLPLLAFVDLGWVTTRGGLVMTLHLGLVATALAYALFSLGLRSTSAPTAATASLFEPVTAGLLGVLLLGESPGTTDWIGMTLILASVGLLATTRHSNQRISKGVG